MLVVRSPRVRALAVVSALALGLFSLQRSAESQRGSRLATTVVDGHEAVADEILVKFVRPLASAEHAEFARQLDADESEDLGRFNLRRLHSRRFGTTALRAFFASHPLVAYAEPNYILHALATPNDPQFPNLWGLLNGGQTIGGQAGLPGADIHASAAWNISTGSAANVVAVIDTGIDYTHPDLVGNVWSAPAPFTVTIGNVPILCAAGTHGFNAITRTCNPMDDEGHGSHVSGTIGARGNNGTGVVGVNWTASIMAAKFLDSTGSGSTSDAVVAIEFAIQAKAAFAATKAANVRVLSNSWGGGGFSQALLDEINKANANDMLFVASAGNNGQNNDTSPSYPASFNAPNVIAVAASDNRDALASFSNYGHASVHLAAPGVNILSTTGGAYQYFSGTSMAAPHVAGAAALILSQCALDTAGLKSNLLANVDVLGSLTGWVNTNGRLNVDKAIRACATPAPPLPPAGVTATAGTGQITVSWGASSGATSYTVKRGTTSGGPYSTVASGVTATSYLDPGLTAGTRYYYVVSAVNLGGPSANSVEVSATPTSAPQTLLTTQVPVVPAVISGAAGFELGTAFTSDVPGQITALRFWKSTSENTPHVGNVWSAAGQLLASVTFTNETTSGWQQQVLAAPVSILANTTYVVSVSTPPDAYFVVTVNAFATALDNGHLHVAAGNNGRYGPVGGFPSSGFPHNFFRDLVFVAQ